MFASVRVCVCACVVYELQVADPSGADGARPGLGRTYRLQLDKQPHFFNWGLFIRYPDDSMFPVYMEFEYWQEDSMTDSGTQKNNRQAKLYWTPEVPRWAHWQALKSKKWHEHQPTKRPGQASQVPQASQEEWRRASQPAPPQASQGSQESGDAGDSGAWAPPQASQGSKESGHAGDWGAWAPPRASQESGETGGWEPWAEVEASQGSKESGHAGDWGAWAGRAGDWGARAPPQASQWSQESGHTGDWGARMIGEHRGRRSPPQGSQESGGDGDWGAQGSQESAPGVTGVTKDR